MTHYHLATRCNNRTIRLTGCGMCTACSDIQTSREGENENVIGQYEVHEREKKKVNAAYIRLMRYFMNIYRYINFFFLEKLFKVILFLIIPIDSIKYLVSYFFFTFCPTSRGPLFFFFETALKVQNTNTDRSMQHLHARLHDN